MRLNISFQALDITVKGNTCQDFVKLENTRDNTSKIYCGNAIPRPFISSSYEVTVIFKTRPNIRQNTGFSLEYLSFGEPIPTTVPAASSTGIYLSTDIYQFGSVYSLIKSECGNVTTR